MAENIIYSPWERTKGPWLCLMTALLFSLLRLFSFVSAFLTSLIKLILWPKFSTGKRQAEDMVGGGGARTIESCSVSSAVSLCPASFCTPRPNLPVTPGISWPVNHKGDQLWIFTGRADAEAEAPIFWPSDAKSQLIGKDPDAGKDWGQEEKGATGWDGWMASPTQWTWVWVNSRS